MSVNFRSSHFLSSPHFEAAIFLPVLISINEQMQEKLLVQSSDELLSGNYWTLLSFVIFQPLITALPKQKVEVENVILQPPW